MACKAHNIRFYNLEPKAIHCMTYESNYRKLAISRGDNSVEVWDVSCTAHVERWLPSLKDNSVEALRWCGPRLFSTGLHGLVVEYDLLTFSKKYEVSVTAGPAWCLDINKNQSHLAVGTEDGYINIFHIMPEGLQYEKVLDKQEGRILCLAWDSTGDMIVTGSADTVRIWNVHTGHAIQKMSTGRNERKKETIVWCLAVTDDFTIISGDSRGRLCFWNGHMGTLTDSFSSHKADILCLCLTQDQNSVYCSGVDSLIVSFARISVRGSQDKCNRWVRSLQRRIHEHDVRALVWADTRLCSAGVDGYLALSSDPPRMLLKYPPLLKPPSIVVCPDTRCALLRLASHLELWQLGELSNGSVPIKLLTLLTCGGEPMICAAASSNSCWVAYSTPSCTRLFNFNAASTGETPQIQKQRGIPQECGASHRIVFFRDNKHVAVATNAGHIVVLRLGDGEPVLLYNLQPLVLKLLKDSVFLMDVSPDGQFLVAADHQGHIAVWSMENGKFHCSLPHYQRAPTALGIQPDTNLLVVVYADHKIVEYSLTLRQYTQFSRTLENKHPKQFLFRGFAISNVAFDPRNPEAILLYDDSTIYVVDKNKELPLVEAKIPRLDLSHSDSLDSSQNPRTSDPQYAFHVVKKYKHLVHLEWLIGDELVIVEVSPSTLAEQLPPVFKRKRFGV